MSIRAIETQYKGYRFRSRLEARWAVFLETLKIKWAYETEGYSADGIGYLPDFELSVPIDNNDALPVFVEIKPNRDITEIELEKALLLSERAPVIIFCGDPYDYFCVYGDKKSPLIIVNKSLFDGAALEDIYFMMGFMPHGDFNEIQKIYRETESLEEANGKSFLLGLVPMLKASKAAEKARAARFEFGGK